MVGVWRGATSERSRGLCCLGCWTGGSEEKVSKLRGRCRQVRGGGKFVDLGLVRGQGLNGIHLNQTWPRPSIGRIAGNNERSLPWDRGSEGQTRSLLPYCCSGPTRRRVGRKVQEDIRKVREPSLIESCCCVSCCHRRAQFSRLSHLANSHSLQCYPA